MEKRYFVIYDSSGDMITGEHINDLNPKMIDALHDNGSVIKSITLEEMQEIHTSDKENKVGHFYNHD
jgi:hypothetical protein